MAACAIRAAITTAPIQGGRRPLVIWLTSSPQHVYNRAASLKKVQFFCDAANMLKFLKFFFACILLPALVAAPAAGSDTTPGARHGLSMHGTLKYPASFTHYDYVNPHAPKGGTLKIAVQGAFDSLNPLIIKGRSGPGIREYVFESLMSRSFDEPFSLYGLIARAVEVPEDRSWVRFILNKAARFSDGRPVTADDVIFSHRLLRDHGRPNHRLYYAKVARVERLGPHDVKFIFKPDGDREMPLIMGLMPVLPKHIYAGKDFEKTTLTPPIGSGPYTVREVKPGASGRLVYQRNPDYWGRDLPVNRGRFNFDVIRYDFYRDENALFEAFKKGLSDVRYEGKPSRWAQAYDFPAVKAGRIVRKTFPMGIPAGMRGLVFNTRRPYFADKRVRKALGLMFNFEWINKTLFHGLYVRTGSYFDRSELSSRGRPASALEQRLLAPFKDAVEPAIMAGTWTPPKSDPSGRDRAKRRAALRLLRAAGYQMRGQRLVNVKTGAPFVFELLSTGRGQERLFLSFARQLRRIGIEVRVRQVDSAQYQRRKTSFDFDMIENRWPASLSPGNEQSFRWGTQAAAQQGSYNYAGVKSPAVDAMIAAMVAARTRPEFVAAVRALDRVLLSGHYVIPLFHLEGQWLAHWTRVVPPKKSTLYGPMLDCWWSAQKNVSTSPDK